MSDTDLTEPSEPYDLDAYLDRIGFKGERRADLATLRGVHLAHALSLPFENLDPVRGTAPSLAPADLMAKMIHGRRGGYCYEHDILLRLALEALGFRVAQLAARVVVGARTTQSGTSYQLKDPTRGNTYTGDAEGKTDLCIFGICFSRAPATLFTDADNHWGSGTTADRASAAVDAQYGTNETWDYYKNIHGRNGIAGDGKGSYNRVHYGSNYNNAFWDDSCFCMTYGDGDGTTFGPLVALDVAGHEMTHGVTSKTAALTYSGESGGLNEATSDILGTMVEWYANNSSDTGDYLIGEKIVKPGFGKAALRFMDKPSKDGSSADYWSSSVGNLDVHYSSGVANHFAYLLAEGSGAKTVNGVAYDSPTYNGSTVTGIGRDKVGKIWYRALTVYMTSSTNYAGARTATLNAAKDLYGAGSTEYNAVAAAWSAVNVG
ncbi:M4 family metallopeptidase [Streptomyces canarius]